MTLPSPATKVELTGFRYEPACLSARLLGATSAAWTGWPNRKNSAGPIGSADRSNGPGAWDGDGAVAVYEVEAKARVRNAEAARRRLEGKGFVFGRSTFQKDYIYAATRASITEPRAGGTVVRIRHEDGEATLNLKKHRANELDVIEYQTLVSDSGIVASILLELGLTPQVVVSKERAKARRGDLTACVDIVEELGHFVELEASFASEPTPSAQESLRNELRDLLADEIIEIATWGYDRLLLATRGTGSGPRVFAATANFRTRSFGEFTIRVTNPSRTLGEHLVLSRGCTEGARDLPYRVTSRCVTATALFAGDCDCLEQIAAALQYIDKEQRGIFIHLDMEGRGNGLAAKISAMNGKTVASTHCPHMRMSGFLRMRALTRMSRLFSMILASPQCRSSPTTRIRSSASSKPELRSRA